MLMNKSNGLFRTLPGLAVSAALAAVLLAGCGHRNGATVGTPGNPLVIVFSPQHVPAAGPEPLQFIARYLSGRTGLTVEAKIAASSMEAIDMLGESKADAGFLTTEEYLVAREEYGVQAALQVLRRDKRTNYEGVILVKAKGGPKDAAALAGAQFAFADPYSISGFFLPSVFLKKEGIKVKPVFAGSHDAAIKALLEGRADAAATYAAAQPRPGLRVLAVTGTAPNEPVAARRGLAREKKEAVMSALADLAAAPDGKRALAAVADITGFRPVSEDVYRPMHELIRSAGKSVYDLIPEGWDIRHLNEPYATY